MSNRKIATRFNSTPGKINQIDNKFNWTYDFINKTMEECRNNKKYYEDLNIYPGQVAFDLAFVKMLEALEKEYESYR